VEEDFSTGQKSAEEKKKRQIHLIERDCQGGVTHLHLHLISLKEKRLYGVTLPLQLHSTNQKRRKLLGVTHRPLLSPSQKRKNHGAIHPHLQSVKENQKKSFPQT